VPKCYSPRYPSGWPSASTYSVVRPSGALQSSPGSCASRRALTKRRSIGVGISLPAASAKSTSDEADRSVDQHVEGASTEPGCVVWADRDQSTQGARECPAWTKPPTIDSSEIL
jgi:hypothetical protein